jgi:hypothetical protein
MLGAPRLAALTGMTLIVSTIVVPAATAVPMITQIDND